MITKVTATTEKNIMFEKVKSIEILAKKWANDQLANSDGYIHVIVCQMPCVYHSNQPKY